MVKSIATNTSRSVSLLLLLFFVLSLIPYSSSCDSGEQSCCCDTSVPENSTDSCCATATTVGSSCTLGSLACQCVEESPSQLFALPSGLSLLNDDLFSERVADTCFTLVEFYLGHFSIHDSDVSIKPPPLHLPSFVEQHLSTVRFLC